MDMHNKLKTLPKVNLNMLKIEKDEKLYLQSLCMKADVKHRNNLKMKYLNGDSLKRLMFNNNDYSDCLKGYNKVIDSTEIFKSRVNKELKFFEQQKLIFEQQYLEGYRKLEEKEKIRK